MSAGQNNPEDRIVAAGEYVLGTLEPAERAQLEAALGTDDELQAEVYRWQDQLLGLALRVEPAALQPDGWAAIEARLGAAAAEPPGTAPSWADTRPPAVTAERGHDPSISAANDASFWRRRVALWRTLAGAALAACLVLALLLTRAPGDAQDASRFVALLQPLNQPAAAAGWLVEVTPGRQLRLVPLAGVEHAAPPRGKVLQFWTKLENAAGPTSLGLVPPDQPTVLSATRLPGAAERQLFELTLEPEGGSPLGRPTGPVLYLGRTFRL